MVGVSTDGLINGGGIASVSVPSVRQIVGGPPSRDRRSTLGEVAAAHDGLPIWWGGRWPAVEFLFGSGLACRHKTQPGVSEAVALRLQTSGLTP
jgi:hypothetical protein